MYKNLWFVLTVVSVMALMTVTAFASSPGGLDIVTTMETAFMSLQTNIFALIAVVVPIILTIVGTWLAIKWGIKMFKSMTATGGN
jgi:hypothetical protein